MDSRDIKSINGDILVPYSGKPFRGTPLELMLLQENTLLRLYSTEAVTSRVDAEITRRQSAAAEERAVSGGKYPEPTAHPVPHGVEIPAGLGDNGEWPVWCEGFAATGDSGGAYLAGVYHAHSFGEACGLAAAEHGWANLYDSQRMTHWGCKLYPTESQARRAFG